MVRIGTSGWVYTSWRRTFYPQGLAQSGWLAHYAKNFDEHQAKRPTDRS